MPKTQMYMPDEVRKPSAITFTDIPVNAYGRTVKEERANFSNEDFLRIFRDMAILREFESALTQIKNQASYNGIDISYAGPAHLSLGQEAAAVGQAYLLTKDDFTFGSHRSHSEILAKAFSAIHKLPDQDLEKIKIITLLHVSTLSCHLQTARIQYLAKLHKYIKCSCW
jgi:2-oxoisovalerate dehydrogenase E1 component